MEEILIGTTDRSILVWIADPAATDGGGKTGLAHSDLTVSYTRVETDNDVVNSDVTSSMNALTNLTDAHNDWGWKEVSSTLSPGLYRLDVADAVFATGAWYAVVQVTITTSLASPTPKVFKLVNLDMFGTPATNIATAGTNYSATRGLSGTALPAAAANADGGLPVLSSSATTLAYTLSTLTTYTGNTPQTGDAYAIVNSGTHGNAALKTLIDAVGNFIDTEVADLTTELAKVPKSDGTASWNATALAALQSEANDALVALKLDHLVAVADADDPVDNSIIAKLAAKGATADWSDFVNTTDSLQALRDRGDAAWITATGFSTHSAADVWAVGTRTLTAGTNIDGSTFTAIPWNASWDAEVQSEVTDALEATVADSVPADGTRPSVASACYMICQGLFEGTISGTTWTIKKVDGSTTLFTVTLNDGTTPTGKMRAT